MNAVEMRNITKRFGSLVANDNVNLTLGQGEIHALLGENGAGKSTLMRILYGLYHADSGEILVKGKSTTIDSPKAAIAHGIGMVTQHFALALPMTVTENVIIGRKPSWRLDQRQAEQEVAQVAQRFGMQINPAAETRHLSVGQRQRVEILKALYRHANVLILDEPTAVLTPQEIDQLFANLRQLQQNGLSVLFISHKLHEIMAITDRVTVLRHGQVVDSVATRTASPGMLAQMMVGRATFGVTRTDDQARSQPMLRMTNLSALDRQGLPALKEITLDVNAGEIVGIAGVSGNGQTELAEVLDGTRTATDGQVFLDGVKITNATPRAVMAAGLGRIPEDRHAAVVGELTVAQNMALEHLDEYVSGGRLRHRQITEHAASLIAAYQIKAAPTDRIRTLSGGNIQKVILARVIERNPKAIVVAQPTRGLDIGATDYVRSKLLEQRAKGAAILLISEDLDEILALADRIAVIYEGQLMDVIPAAAATEERIGLLMAGIRPPVLAVQP